MKLAGLHVLCVDNEPQVLDGMEALLTGWGCQVSKAPDLDSAFATLALIEVPPMGVLVDYHLDRGNGLEAITALRMRFGAGLPAILITADRDAQVRDGARAANVAVLYKPLKPAALRSLISQWRTLGVAAAE